jgi:DNA-binding winged helix-turn-helix (wHTH) protein
MRVVFGECEFDSGQRRLLRHGRAVPLSGKAFQLLELLLDRRPEAVTKAEMLERLWPGTFVSDASLHNLVTEIRRALGDAPRVARYIRTVPRYGYAFQAEARGITAAQTSRRSPAGPHLVSTRREWPLVEGSNLIGRDHECLVRIDSATLSRRHARLIVAGAGTTLEDLGSKNGTMVNGRRVTQAVALNDNDEVQVGAVTLRYRLLGMLPSTLTRHDTPSR